MTPDELLSQATKYRAVAMSLPPNMPGAHNRDYYLARAAELEQQATSATVATIPHPPKIGGDAAQLKQQLVSKTETKVSPAITLNIQTRVHSRLAAAVLRDKRMGMHRAFAMWLTLRQGGDAWYLLPDVIEFYARKTGNHPRNVRRWLNAGDGVFWHLSKRQGKRYLAMIGKNRVFASYELSTPGKVLLIDTDELLGKLQVARAALYGCWLDKESRWASRATIAQITGVTERSQRNYDNRNRQRKQHTYALNWRVESGGIRQMPNRYFRNHLTPHSTSRGKRYGLYSPEKYGLIQHGEKGQDSKPQRLLYDNARTAVQQARHRAKLGQSGQCFSVLEPTRGGNLLLKVYDYALA